LQIEAYFFGFSRWKHAFIRPFFSEEIRLHFINPLFKDTLSAALSKGLDAQSHIYIWGKKPFAAIEQYAQTHGNKVFRVEDGFIRSIGLGSDLTQPYSLVVDSRGIYFDPAQPSELEHLLQYYEFDEALLQRASNLRQQLINSKLSKYNSASEVELALPSDKIVSLVIGQVEDDASIIFGANSMSNSELLRVVKECYAQHYIIYKPHPDVVSGNRIGNVAADVLSECCDMVVEDISITLLLEKVDEVHTMTSLTGFEAMIRGKKVYTYGQPFYSSWGLSIDEQPLLRRNRVLSIEAMIAAVYILYPRYLSPKRKTACEVEEVISELLIEKRHLEQSWLYRNFKTAKALITRLILQKATYLFK